MTAAINPRAPVIVGAGQIVQRPGMMVVLTEYYHSFRLIPTDGSPHSADIIPTYFGDSAGRWEGDTLVVDVAGFNDKTWLADARDRPTPTSRGVWLHSDALHVTERWRMLDADTLQYQAVVEDPKMLTGPWTSPLHTVKRQPFGKSSDDCGNVEDQLRDFCVLSELAVDKAAH